MVFAKDQAEYDKLNKEMHDKVNGLGYSEVMDFSIKKAEELFDTVKALNKHG